MIKLGFAVAASLVAALGAVGCGSSSSSSGSITCVMSVLGTQSCLIEKNVPASDQSQIKSMCTKGGGKLEACPTANLLGCCSNTASANGQTVTMETCQYPPSGDAGAMMDAGVTAGYLKQQCTQENGNWTTSP